VYEVYSPTTFHRIIPQIRTLAENPRPSGCRKLTGLKNDWRIRIGEYRVLYEIDERAKAVRIMRVRHRREAYRR
jgi:mRNA interferase RelE/StbE